MNMNTKSFAAIMLLYCLVAVKSLETKNEMSTITSTANQSQNEPKIINGTEANWFGTRHQVSLRLQIADWNFGAGHICGGSLIAADVVLTAAHCIWNSVTEQYRQANEFSVAMGNLDRFLSDNNTLIFNVSKISTRSDFFDMSAFEDDVAILFLDKKVPSNFTRASPIALNENRNVPANTMCEVSGWGKTETGEAAAKLMVVNVPIVGRTECAASYHDLISDGMICAGYMEGQRDSCAGDSGGPLVCGNKLTGVVSFGNGCAEPGFPGVYADVATYAGWIRNQTGIESGARKISLAFSMISCIMLTFLCSYLC